MLKEISVSSSRKQEILDITEEINSIVKESEVKEGICVVYVPHATCAVIINENYDPNVMLDIVESLNKNVPEGIWKHDSIDNNGAAHIKSSVIGPSETIIIKNGSLQLGRWQDIMVCDFDGPKEIKIFVKVMKD
ncbi:MAG: YjbQ family protein [archaeon]|nr:MAG: YjbQ family protein [archaeon]